MDDHSQIDGYTDAAGAVRRRVGQVRFARWLRCGHWIVGALGIVIVLALRRFYEWRQDEIWPVLALIGAWLLAGGVFALAARPGTRDSLLMLDRLGGWKDRFSSAWAFLTASSRDAGQELHLERTGGRLADAVAAFPTTLPLPRLGRAWIGPALAALLALIPLWRTTPDAGEMKLTEEMRQAAARQADELKREAQLVEDRGGLQEQEQEDLEKLRVEVEEAAEGLAEAGELTAGEMLESLETRARAAEKLAEKLGLASDGWASEQMLEEMRRHPDTVDLGLAIEDKAAELAADESMKLHEVLDHPELTRETIDRFTATLERITQAATEADEKRPVGERVGNASRKMLADQPRTAAREFEALAKHFRILGDREKTRDELEKLAENLREAGSEISGSELEKMEQVAEQSREGRPTPEGLQSLEADPLAQNLERMTAPGQSGESGEQSRPASAGQQPGQSQEGAAPDLAQATQQGQSPGEGQQSMMKAPVPGETPSGSGDGSEMGLANRAQPGEGEDGQLSAPVPGMNTGQAQPGQGLSGSSGGQSNQAAPGGNQAGSGTAELKDSQSDPLAARRDGRVDAQINQDGESTVRAVEGQARRETAQRERREVVTDFLAAEEQALDGKSLPMSRREHVVRYFSALRRQFEDEGGGQDGEGGQTP